MTMELAFFQRVAAPFPVALAVSAIVGIAAANAALAAVASASPWIDSSNSKVRLVSGTVDLDGKFTLLAGVQLRMNSGWKTYWKNPGDSGVPPSFDWSGSKNLKHAEVLYPAPHRFADANGTAIGYDDEVVFPVRLTPEREGEPIVLKLAFDYGLCKDLCIPNDVTLGLALAADAGKGDALLLETFLTRVPKPAKSGVLPEVSGVEARLDGEAPELVVDAAFPPDATGTDLFIDAGDSFVPVPRPLGPLADGRQRFAVTFATSSEADAIKGKTLALTLVSDQGSIETMWKAE
ncbi:MAG: protein-disulfide reductase DsbD domain-containing protein [Methyloceanibacter sp.]